MKETLSYNALKGLKNTDGGVSPRQRLVEAIALKGRQIVLPPLRGFVGERLFLPGAYTPVCNLASLQDYTPVCDLTSLRDLITIRSKVKGQRSKEMDERFFREAGFLLGCDAKPTGYSGMLVQGLSSLLEQNLERQLRMKAQRDCSTDKGFYCFCFNNIRNLN